MKPTCWVEVHLSETWQKCFAKRLTTQASSSPCTVDGETRNDRHRLHSSHLYQLNAYLQNKARQTGWEKVEGILLYPAVNHRTSVQMKLLGHRMRVVSIDLDRGWSEIHSDLLTILA